MSRLSFAHFPSFSVRTAVFCLATAVLLSGCQGSSAPSGSASETSSTTASPASSVSAPPASATPVAPAIYKPADANGKAQNVPVPVMPELAKENSKAGLEAFVGYWYATFSYATESGDLGPWIATTDTSNTVAVAYRKALERNYSQGMWMVGGTIVTPRIEVLWTDGAAIQEAKVQVIQSEIRYFNADGTVGREVTPVSNIAEAVFAKFADGTWRVTNNGMIVG